VRNENDRLFRPDDDHDLQLHLHVDGNAGKQYDGMHVENGRIFDDVLHRSELVRNDDAILQSLQRIFDENDELLYALKGMYDGSKSKRMHDAEKRMHDAVHVRSKKEAIIGCSINC